jgi:hypothetical protein
MMSTATAARIPPPVPDGGACGEPLSLQQTQELGASFRLLGQCSQKVDGPGLHLPRRPAGERLGAGQQRASKAQQPAPLPVAGKRRAKWRAFAVTIEPGPNAERGAEQRRSLVGRRQHGSGAPDRL